MVVMRVRFGDDDYSNDKDTLVVKYIHRRVSERQTDPPAHHAIRNLGALNKRVTVGGGGDVWTMQTVGRYLWRGGREGGGGEDEGEESGEKIKEQEQRALGVLPDGSA